MGLQRLQVHEDLALVVHRAPGVDAAVPLVGLEGRGGPLVKRLRRLDVVVPIDQEGRGIGARLLPLPQHHWMARGLQDLGHQAHVAHALCQPSGGRLDVSLVLRARTDGGDPEEVEEFLLEAGLLPVDKGFIVGHGHSLASARFARVLFSRKGM